MNDGLDNLMYEFEEHRGSRLYLGLQVLGLKRSFYGHSAVLFLERAVGVSHDSLSFSFTLLYPHDCVRHLRYDVHISHSQ